MTVKVLLSEINFKGHRKTYMECLSQIKGIEFYVLAPENFGIETDHYYKNVSCNGVHDIKSYLKWLWQIKKIVSKNDIDVVHILDGDSIMRWFGLGFNFFNAKKIIITYHHFFSGSVRKLSYWLMCHGKKRVAIAHTSSVKRAIKNCYVDNVLHIAYPAFNYERIASLDKKICKLKYGVPISVPTIGIIGGLNMYKNILQFLCVIQKSNKDFHLLIAGKEGDITQKQIESAVKSYKEKVTLNIKFLSNQEYEESIMASDIIFCIYGKDFDGASGPLIDGVCAEKLILSCSHGSLGEIVLQNSLGFTADCDDKLDILNKVNEALNEVEKFKYGIKAHNYRESLTSTAFQKKYKDVYLNKIYL